MSDTDTTRRTLDAEMVEVAKRRGIVRLANGELVTLICWGTRSGRNRVRLESQDGRVTWSALKRDIAEVVA